MYSQVVFVVFLSVLGQSIGQSDICSQVPPGESFLYPYPGDCSKYYRCDGNEVTVVECPDGLWFNQAVQSCDVPEQSGCSIVRILTLGYSPQTEEYDPPTNAPTTPGTDPRCVDGVIDYFPHPTDCSKYIECYDGESIVMNCPDGYWFNAELKRCEEPESSGCIPDGGTGPTDSPPTTGTPGDGGGICDDNDPDNTILKPVQGDCNAFWQCVGIVPIKKYCPPHLYFNPPKQTCDWPSEVNCDGTTGTMPTPPTRDPTAPTTTPGPTQTPPNGIEDPRCVNGDITYWPHPSDCAKYIECYNYLAYEMDCPAGLFFDADDQKCTDPEDANCSGSTGTPSPPTTGTPGHDPDCPEDDDGKRYLFPYEGDCTKFWECFNGAKIERTCPADLWFNPVLLVCDYPEDSGCEYA